MKRVTSLTTVETFLTLIAHLPFRVVERGVASLKLMPTEVLGTEAASHLFHALELSAGKRGLKARRGVAVWSVRGFAGAK